MITNTNTVKGGITSRTITIETIDTHSFCGIITYGAFYISDDEINNI